VETKSNNTDDNA